MSKKRQPAASRFFRRRSGAMLLLDVISALAAEEIADREHGEKWIRERIEEEMEGSED